MEIEIQKIEQVVFEGSSIFELFTEDTPLIDLDSDKCWPSSF